MKRKQKIKKKKMKKEKKRETRTKTNEHLPRLLRQVMIPRLSTTTTTSDKNFQLQPVCTLLLYTTSSAAANPPPPHFINTTRQQQQKTVTNDKDHPAPTHVTLQKTDRCRGTLSLWQGTHWMRVPWRAHLDHSRGLKLLALGQLALAQTLRFQGGYVVNIFFSVCSIVSLLVLGISAYFFCSLEGGGGSNVINTTTLSNNSPLVTTDYSSNLISFAPPVF